MQASQEMTGLACACPGAACPELAAAVGLGCIALRDPAGERAGGAGGAW